MTRGFERPPLWALIVMLVGAVCLVGGLIYTSNRTFEDPLSQAERDRMTAAAEAGRTAPASTAAPTEQAPTPVSVQRPSDRPLRVLFAGDSLTGGLYASSQGTAFKWLMLDALDDGGEVEEFNSAISGGTAVEVSEAFDVPEDLHLAVVELGTNDLGKATPLPDFEAAYVSLLDRVTAGSPDVALLCAGVWEAAPGPSAGRYNGVIQGACEGHGGQFVSLTPIYSTGKAIGPAGQPALGGESDDFHPNDTGHRAIADALLARISVVG